MKQVVYDFTLREIATFLANNEDPSPAGVRPFLEDGHWELQFITESGTLNLPQIVAGQQEGPFPGHMVRILGARLIKIYDPPYIGSYMIEVRNRKVVPLGSDPDQCGHEESSGTVGEDSRYSPNALAPTRAGF